MYLLTLKELKWLLMCFFLDHVSDRAGGAMLVILLVPVLFSLYRAERKMSVIGVTWLALVNRQKISQEDL